MNCQTVFKIFLVGFIALTLRAAEPEPVKKPGAYLGELTWVARFRPVPSFLSVLEGRWPYGRTVVIKFPGQEELERWYRSPEYRELVVHRHKASTANIVAVKGR